MVPLAEDGGLQQQQDEFDGLFGFSPNGGYEVLSQTLLTLSVGTTGVTVSDKSVWSIPPGTKWFEISWVPSITGRDTATANVSVRSGLIVAVSGGKVPPHSANSMTLAVAPGAQSTPDLVAIAPADASPAAVPDLGVNKPQLFTEPPEQPGLGSAALWIIAMTLATATMVPALLILRDRRVAHVAIPNLPGLFLALTGACASAIEAWDIFTSSSTWQALFIPVSPIAVLPILIAVFGCYQKLGLRQVLTAWLDAIVLISFAMAAGAVVFLAGASSKPVDSAALVLSMLAAALFPAWRSSSHIVRLAALLVPMAALLLTSALSTTTSLSIDQTSAAQWLADDAWPGVAVTASMVAIASASVGASGRSPRADRWIIVVVSLAGMPLLGVASNGYLYWADANQATVAAALFVAAAAGISVMAKAGGAASGVVDARARIGAIAVLAVTCSGFDWISPSWAGFCSTLTIIAGFVLLPRSRTQWARILATVGQREHLRHVLRLQQARTKAAVDRRYHYDSAAAIADEKLTMADYEGKSARLRLESAKAADPRRTELALGTLAGSDPWHSGLAGLSLGTIIGLPLMVATVARSAESTWSAFQAGSVLALALIVLHVARWSAYGLVYGYFYPMLRGRTAFAKSAWFAAVLLVPELTVPWVTHTPSSVVRNLGIDTVQLFAFAAVLALAWEFRQARRAGVSWDGVRDLRSLRALAAPAGAILLALVTAAATTLANEEIPTWVAPSQTQTAPTAPAPTPSQQ
jgi:hypothetical protein